MTSKIPKPDYDVLMGRKTCARYQDHYPNQPKSAEEHRNLQKTMRVRPCPGCGLWVIWDPKTGE